MALPLQKPIHLFDYFALDNASQERHEYVGGRIYAMTGGTMRHNRISGNIFRVLANRLDGSPCQVFINDMKLHVQAADSVYYPDVFVYCGSATANDDKVAQDATLVVEVLSESTAAIDRREKLVAYQKLPGLRAYWIVSQTEQHIEVHSRGTDGRWQALAYTLGESIPAEWLGGEPVALGSVYAGTDIAA
jgi:Uma2 family endonuclease